MEQPPMEQPRGGTGQHPMEQHPMEQPRRGTGQPRGGLLSLVSIGAPGTYLRLLLGGTAAVQSGDVGLLLRLCLHLAPAVWALRRLGLESGTFEDNAARDGTVDFLFAGFTPCGVIRIYHKRIWLGC